MADELDPVTQRFEADVAEYTAAMNEAAGAAQEFAAASEEAKAAEGGLRDASAETGAAVGGVRDKLAEAAAAMKIYRDEQGKMRDSAGEVVAASEVEARALKHIRDQALEAAWAMRDLEKYQRGSMLTGLASKLGGLFGGGGGSAGGGGGAASAIPLIGTLAESPELLIAIVPAVMAIVTEVGALATGLTAAGLGVGGFAALALPAFKSVAGAYGQINKDQKAYDDALTATAKNKALQKLKDDYADLDPNERGALKGIQSLTAEFSKMSKAFEPTAFKVFNQLLGIANQLLPYLGKFANAAAPAIEGVLGSLSKGLDSPAFKKFMDFLASLSGPAITAIGSGMAGLGKDVMQLMESFSKKDVINAINIAFRLLGAALSTLIWIIKASMATWDWITQKALPAVRDAFDVTRHAVATAGHGIAEAFDTVRHAIATAGHDIAHAFDEVRHTASAFGHDVTAAFEAVVSWVSGHWKEILAWLVSPVGMAVYEIKTHTHEIAQAFDQLRHDIAAILAGTRHDISAAWDAVRHDVAAFVDAIPGTVKNAFNDIYQFIKTVDTDILHALQAAWNAVVSAVSKAVKDVLSFFEKLPGQVVSALAKLPGEMLAIGENVIKGLINGIVNAAKAIPSIMSGLASTVASYFTNPLKLFSPSRVFFDHGWNIVQGAINGVKANAPALLSTMRGLGAGVAAQGTGSALAAGASAPAGGSTSVHVTVPVTLQGGAAAGASPQYLQGLQAAVQEAVLRYAQVNPGNGFTPAWGR